MKFLKVLGLAAAVLIGATACGGGGSSGSSSSSGNNGGGGVEALSAGGYWVGTQSISGEPDLILAGLVTENGDFHFLREDDVQFVGQLSVTGDRAVGTYIGEVDDGDEFLDGSESGTGELDLRVSERRTLSGTFVFTTENGQTDSGTIELTYDSLYDEPSSTSIVSGTFTSSEEPFSDSLNIDTTGQIFYQNSDSGCVANGQIDPVDTRFNAYDVSFTFEGCTGEDAILNGLPFDGIAMLDFDETPEQLILAVSLVVEDFQIPVLFYFDRID